ncbi:MAG TPA: Crp/Fnr family transcriptional regulator [Gaiellaceae bacterium]|jgi:CRP/FNR family transcriptional regulator|nr:Crp/Fnr family transcriptional regulator [Gaiellaceae bacterium]
MATDPADALRRVPLLAGLQDRERERLARELHERTFPAGSTVVSEGATGAGFFVIADGMASVTVNGQDRGRLGPGDYFGEMALIDEAPRSATITADSDIRAYGMTPWEFKPFVLGHPEVAWTLLRTLSNRLREAQSRSSG